MKLFALFFLIGCGSEDIGQTSQSYFNTCDIEYNIPNTSNCTNEVYRHCVDGTVGFQEMTALGSNFIGTVCYQDEDNTWYYECELNDKNYAWVVCDK